MVLMSKTRGKQIKPTKLQAVIQAGLPKDECWLYPGALDKDGYAYAYDQTTGKSGRGARIAYRLTFGDVPDDMVVDHVSARNCVSRACVNPYHLEAVSQATNVQRSKSSTKRSCKHGHVYTKANTYYTKEGWRQCRVCQRRRSKRREP
ncbi:hypothetical protein BH789_gp035 [Gordonia phage GMA6]|uniref:Uncharacterized protein n=1 Tax=Gordonia phage GMA6 TaxID=1647285 RepID=A0A0K0NKR7_9CAUD|nr:hypothetical protein BH789_gp035 [Gordonia phage GMA6]AKL88316.1 hypothetical protein GMA6_35 [Gordonia phage GMA6]